MSCSGAEIAGEKVTLRSSDGKVYEVEEVVASKSQTIKAMVEAGFADDVIPLPNVTGEILSKTIEYCKKHVDAASAKANYFDEGCKILREIIEYGNEHVTSGSESLLKIIKDFEKQVYAASTVDDDLDFDDLDHYFDLALYFMREIIVYGKKHVTGELLSEIIKVCEGYVNALSTIDDDLKAFDANFVKVDAITLFELIMAANFLDIKSLLDLTCQAVADMIKRKTPPPQDLEALGIRTDYTPKEVEEIRRELIARVYEGRDIMFQLLLSGAAIGNSNICICPIHCFCA